MKEGEVETMYTADLKTIKNYGARLVKQMIWCNLLFPHTLWQAEIRSSAFTIGLYFTSFYQRKLEESWSNYCRSNWQSLGQVLLDSEASSNHKLLSSQERKFSHHSPHAHPKRTRWHHRKWPIKELFKSAYRHYVCQTLILPLFCPPSLFNLWHQTAETAGLKISMCKSWFQL